MSEEKFYKVKNRSAGVLVYTLPEIGIRREFAPGEIKKISFEELQKLSYQSGGKVMINNYLQITDTEIIKDLNIKTEQEYFMSEAQIAELIQKGSLDEFLDCLDFAPNGVIDILKDLSVKIPLTDYNKRKALKEKTGFDVDVALKNIEAEKADQVKDTSKETAPKRRVQKEENTQVRRTEGKYKVINS